jgi:hypothetical protein
MNTGDHPHFAPPRELHGKGADVARAAVDKDRLFLAQAGVVEQHLPSRHGDDGHRQWQAARARSYQGIPVAYPRGAHANENFLVLRLRYVDPL